MPTAVGNVEFRAAGVDPGAVIAVPADGPLCGGTSG